MAGSSGGKGGKGASAGGASNADLQDDEDRMFRRAYFRAWAKVKEPKLPNGSPINYVNSPAPPKR